MDQFLTLEDLLLRPPFASLAAILLVLGLGELGRRIAHAFRQSTLCDSLDYHAGFVLAAALLAAVVHGLALAQLASLVILRPLAMTVALAGVWSLLASRSRLLTLVSSLRELWRRSRTLEQAVLLGCGMTLVGLILAALGPPTDIDSLDYHLGVPLDWLRRGGAVPNQEWFHARLSGLGEGLNLLGLAAGTDNFGALLQIAGLVIAVHAVAVRADESGTWILGCALVIACPVMALLSTTQKAQLLPAAATTLAVVLVRDPKRVDVPRLIGVFGCLSFAMGCKYSFLFSGGLAAGLAYWSAFRAGCLRSALIISWLCMMMFAAPVYLRNSAFYGDPLSPCLERWLGNDPAIIAFARHLQDFGGAHTASRIIKLPLRLIIPTGPDRLTEVLGIGTLAAVWGIFGLGRSFLDQKLLLAAGVLALLNACFGQLSPRFFLESYLWAAAAVVSPGALTSPRWLLGLLLPQSLVTAIIAWVGAATLFPGALTSNWRDAVQRRTASTYEAAVWLDEVLPADAVIATDLRCQALLPRPAVPSDYSRFLTTTPLPDEDKARLLAQVLRRHHVQFVVVRDPDPGNFAVIGQMLGEQIAGSVTFDDATRNPFNRGSPYQVRAYRMRDE